MRRETTWAIVGLVVLVLVLLGVAYFASAGGSRTSGEGWEAPSGALVTDGMAAFLDELHYETGLFYYLTSGTRDAEAQARAMLAKVAEGQTKQDLLNLYSRDDLVEELYEYPVNQESWAAVIQAQMDRGDFLSSHMGGRGLDLRTSGGGEGAIGQLSAGEVAATITAAKGLGARCVEESTPPHLHINITGFLDNAGLA